MTEAPADLTAAVPRGYRRPVRRTALALTACLALVAAACTSEADENPLEASNDGSGDQSSATGSDSPDEGAGDTLDWEECGGDAECATLDVPVDYDQPEALAEVLHSLGIRHPDGAPPLDPAAALRVLAEHGSPLGTLSSDQLASVAEVFTNNLNAQRRHDSRPVDVDVLFFEAIQDKAPDPERPGDWAPYTSGRIESHPIACRHGDMLAPGPLADIAAVLTRHLDGPDHIA